MFSDLDVPVRGGLLRVGIAGTGPTPVLAVHGITGSHRSWTAVARCLGDTVTVVAPDLRGRGHSGALPGPYGLDVHVGDLLAVLDHRGVERAVVAGHSMGAYIAARFAAAHPDRTAGVVLVDGGLPLPVPEGADPDVVLEAVLGPALARLRMDFESPAAYRQFWLGHPALGPRWSPDIEDYVDYDLLPLDGAYCSRVSEAAVRADGRDLLDGAAAWKALTSMPPPVVLVRAPRGLLDEPNPLLPEAVVDEARRLVPVLGDVVVDDTNHYLIVMGEREAAAVAAEISRLARL
jgi:pimeloyl-ACP methyl ester carboxylesterase